MYVLFDFFFPIYKCVHLNPIRLFEYEFQYENEKRERLSFLSLFFLPRWTDGCYVLFYCNDSMFSCPLPILGSYGRRRKRKEKFEVHKQQPEQHI